MNFTFSTVERTNKLHKKVKSLNESLVNETKCLMKQNVKFRTILTKQTKGQVTQNFLLCGW